MDIIIYPSNYKDFVNICNFQKYFSVYQIFFALGDVFYSAVLFYIFNDYAVFLEKLEIRMHITSKLYIIVFINKSSII